MQALSERLHEMFAGAALEKAVPLQFSAAKTFDPPLDAFVGATLEAVGRRGKFLVFTFGELRLLMHLSQGGRIEIEQPPKTTRPKGATLRLQFGGRGGMLLREYGTQRKAGWWTLRGDDDGPLEKLGPEPGSGAFRELIRNGDDGRRIHTLLRDQRTVAGIGRGFSDDILHRAKLSPYTSLKKLDAEQRESLLEATDEVLAEALASERKRTGGLPAKLPDRFKVHGRAGRPCPRCGETLKRVSFEGYEIAYCPACQTEGKVLADRRMSRLLK